jgi:hypothetical protein
VVGFQNQGRKAMKYSKVKEMVAGLRELADFLEERGHLLPVDYLSINVHDYIFDDSVYSNRQHKMTAQEKMRVLAKALDKAEKHYQGDYFDLRRKFGPIQLEFTVSRDKICERVVVGTKEVPERVVPARTEEIVEWVCNDPILREDAA